MKIGKLYRVNHHQGRQEGDIVIIKNFNRLVARVYNLNTGRVEDYFISELDEVKNEK